MKVRLMIAACRSSSGQLAEFFPFLCNIPDQVINACRGVNTVMGDLNINIVDIRFGREQLLDVDTVNVTLTVTEPLMM
jgi:hypothetical protein